MFERIATSEDQGTEPFGIVDRDELGDDPPVSLPTSTTSLSSSAARTSATMPATPPMVWSAPGRSGLGCAPSGQVGRCSAGHDRRVAH